MEFTFNMEEYFYMIVSQVLWLSYTLGFCYMIVVGYLSRQLSLTIISIFMFFYYSIRPVFIYAGFDGLIPDQEYSSGLDYSALVLANLSILLWFLVFLFTYNFRRVKNNKQLFLLDMITPVISGYFVWVVSVIVIFLNLSFMLTYGDVNAFVYFVKVKKSVAGNYYYKDFLLVTSICLSYSLVGFFILKNWVSLFITSVILMFSLYLIYCWGERTSIALVFFCLAVSFKYIFNQIKFRYLIASALVFLISIQILKDIRLERINTQVGSAEDAFKHENLVRDISLSLHLAEYDGLILAIRDIGASYDVRYGEDFLNGFLSFIPRGIWSGKPDTYHIGHWFRQLYEPEIMNGWPVTPVGDWFVNFHFFGVFFGAFISALMARHMDDRLKKIHVLNPVFYIAFSVLVIGAGVGTNFFKMLLVIVVAMFLMNLDGFFERGRRVIV